MKNKKKIKTSPTQYALIFVVSILYNYSVVSVAIGIVLLIITIISFFTKAEINYENATFENVFLLIVGIIIFYPIRKMKNKLQE